MTPPKRRKRIGGFSPINGASSLLNSPAEAEVLVLMLQELSDNIGNLVSTCGRLESIRCLKESHLAYTRLHNFLDKHCDQHDAHSVAFDLQDDEKPNAVKFLFALPSSNTSSTVVDEDWLAFKATVHCSSDQSPSIDGPLECLINSAPDARALVERQVSSSEVYNIKDVELARDQTENLNQAAYTLSEINQVLQDDYRGVVTEVSVLQLAKQLATAVLKFKYTPWYSAPWSCDNIVLFIDDNNFENILSLPKPHFRIRLNNTPDQISKACVSATESMLFCLGLVLYKLWTHFPLDDSVDIPPLKTLVVSNLSKITEDINDQMDRWLSLDKISQTYAEIVRWCLNSFNRTTQELDDPLKLREIYEIIICGLEATEMEYAPSTAQLYNQMKKKW